MSDTEARLSLSLFKSNMGLNFLFLAVNLFTVSGFLISFIIFNFKKEKCMSFCLYVSFYKMPWCPWRPEEGIGSPRNADGAITMQGLGIKSGSSERAESVANSYYFVI